MQDHPESTTQKIHDTAALGREIVSLCTYIHAATYRLLFRIREFDNAGGWHQPGLCSCAHWLNFQCGIGENAAREKVRVAHALADLPKISRAFERGELSYSKVRAMTRVANESNEDYLLMIAHHGTAHHVEKLVQKYRRAKRLQDCEEINAQHAGRYVDHYYDADGCLVIKARLPAEQGALIVKAVEHALEHDTQPQNEQREECDDPEARVSREPIGARRADALAEVAETYLANPDASGSAADRYQVVVHVTAEGSAPDGTSDPLANDAHDPHIEDGPYVTAETSRRLSCDCARIDVVENGDGEPLSIGRKSRSIPPAIRRALRLRDGGCRFPGCTRNRFVDGHHIEHWSEGGETSLDNLVLLCRHHHRLVHEGGYGCERSPDGEIVFSAPDETPLPRHAKVQHIELDPFDWFERELRLGDLGTCVPEWYAGETIDWDLAVWHLFQADAYDGAENLSA